MGPKGDDGRDGENGKDGNCEYNSHRGMAYEQQRPPVIIKTDNDTSGPVTFNVTNQITASNNRGVLTGTYHGDNNINPPA
jgi:hypothetical protein